MFKEIHHFSKIGKRTFGVVGRKRLFEEASGVVFHRLASLDLEVLFFTAENW